MPAAGRTEEDQRVGEGERRQPNASECKWEVTRESEGERKGGMNARLMGAVRVERWEARCGRR
jgi:hypothetical protein